MNVKPFGGYRYAEATGADVSAVVAPPYDQIDAPTQDTLLAMSPHNVVRITLPRDEPDVDRYQGARHVLDAWLTQRVWAADDRPAIYPYQQTYTIGGKTITRSSFIALGEVSEYARGVVLPHERTHSGPKKDRMQLLEATGADAGLLFILVSDPDRAILVATAPTSGGCSEPPAVTPGRRRPLDCRCGRSSGGRLATTASIRLVSTTPPRGNASKRCGRISFARRVEACSGRRRPRSRPGSARSPASATTTTSSR